MTTDIPGGFATLGELGALAESKVPADVWAYVAGGAGEETALRANRDAFHRQTLRPRLLTGASALDLRTRILSQIVSAPFFLAPLAYQGLVHPDGELASARAAQAAGVLAIESTLSSFSLEEIAAATPMGPKWFQLYLQPEFAASERLVRRAEKAGYRAIVLTADVPILAQRDRQIRGGVAIDAPVPTGNGPDVTPPARAPSPDGLGFRLRPDASQTWSVLERLRGVTRLPVLVKGVLTREDARAAVDHGAAGVIVSNHGGRQLDAAPAALDALPEVVGEVGSTTPVLFDSGVRRGGDIVVALAMGATAVGVGRPVMWALATAGEAGVSQLLSLLRLDLANVLAVTGRASVASIDRSILGPPRW
ncbi:MAG TPA: alpha-hydroxy acid oxidase [Thermoplasmata archaeon]|nr:alpha-hydroxy acid oxidase [Thermoplasmata archaeon]